MNIYFFGGLGGIGLDIHVTCLLFGGRGRVNVADEMLESEMFDLG